MIEFEDLKPVLKKVLSIWVEPENWGDNLRQVCEKAEVNYNTVRKEIARVGTDDFYDLKARMVDKALVRHHSAILKALAKKAEQGNTRAIELYLKATNRLAEKYNIELSGSLDLSVQSELLNLKKKISD